MIDHITKISRNDEKTGKSEYKFHVFYKQTGRRFTKRTFTWKQELPMTVVNFLVNAECCDTIYTTTGKVERIYN